MPLPLILAGAALVAGGYGVKKGVDAKGDFDKAKNINRKAKRIHDEAKGKLEDAHANAKNSMENLGKKKLIIWTESIDPFIEVFQKIKNIDVHDSDLAGMEKLPVITESDLVLMRKTAMSMKELASGGSTALGSGGLAGLAAYGSVQMLASASTGTAISALSGAAATNATLAWLGGGSLATGGMGIAGGTAVLGGIVAGPVLAVGGMMMASKAETAKEDAYSNLSKAEVEVENMTSGTVAVDGLRRRFNEINTVLMQLNSRLKPALGPFIELVNHNPDYSTYSEEDKKEVFKIQALAKTIKNILDTKILDSEGALTPESRQVVREGNKFLHKI
ncbi:hypothetical protein [Marinobacterium marinum]|uniref:Uncharacterized protein n=1 Tax=Marinobacterium marinum TaxID=2756129 RepID=A0A7W1WV93_9GAMM|nr:hypothetical protein [Marinobacterium marinum]MBA4500870.1 hypothetical protein [Marinobacterium marinum]